MGPEPSEVDCAMFGMLVMILWNMPDSKHEKYAKGGCLGCSTGPEYFFFLQFCVYSSDCFFMHIPNEVQFLKNYHKFTVRIRKINAL